MLSQLDNYFFSLPEPEQGCLLFLRHHIINYSKHITDAWKYNTPFFYYKRKWLCYLSYHKKTKVIYIGFVNGYKINHPKLLAEGRKQVKVFYVDANRDTDIKSLNAILKLAIKVDTHK